MADKKRCCALTFVKNENVFLPIWLKYYSKYFNAEDIYVIDHNSDDGSLEACRKQYQFNVIRVHHEYFDDVWKLKTAHQKHAELLQRYEYVLYTDADEIIIPNPKKYRDLKDYIARHDSDCVACAAYVKGYETIPDAEAGLKEYFDFYNLQRHHQSLGYKTPWLVYSGLEVAQNPNPVA